MSARLRVFFAISCLLSLAGCHARKQSLLDAVDKSMSDIRCADGCVGAVPPPQNINIDHVPVPFPVMPDPRTPMAGAERWELDLGGALAVALGNSEVVRALPGATTSVSGSTLGGSSRGSFGAGGQNPAAATSNVGGSGGAAGGGAPGAGFNANSVGGGAGGGGSGAITSGQYATIYDPAIAAAQVESALGAFDASFATSMFWERLENPPGQTFGGFITTRPTLDTAYWRSSITKPFVTGTLAAVRFNNNYYFVPPPDVAPSVNPQYQTNLEFAVLQPLLRGYGTQVGRMPILIAGAEANQSAWEFKRRMMAMVRSVESAYWNLYSAQLSLRAIEEALPLYGEVVRVEDSRLRARVAVPADVAQAQADFLELRGQRLQALSSVAQQQALLRNLMGLPPTDGRQIVLREQPLKAPLVIDWDETVNIALDRRPDVIRQRLAVHVREMEVVLARNALLPQLNGEALYRLNGLGENLGSSLDLLGENRFQDWRLGVSLEVPIGNHVARGQMRASQMQLLREQALLKQTAHVATHQLADVVRDIDWVYQQYEVAARRQTANGEWQQGARARFVTPAGGVSLLQALDIYLRSIRAAVTANQNAASLLAQYNIALARLEEAKGTILGTHSIYVYNDPCTAVQRTMFGGPRDCKDLIDTGILPIAPGSAEPMDGSTQPAPPMAVPTVVAPPVLKGAPVAAVAPQSAFPFQGTSAPQRPEPRLAQRPEPKLAQPKTSQAGPQPTVAEQPRAMLQIKPATVSQEPALASTPAPVRRTPILSGPAMGSQAPVSRPATATKAATENQAPEIPKLPSSRRDPLRFTETTSDNPEQVRLKMDQAEQSRSEITSREAVEVDQPTRVSPPAGAPQEKSAVRLKLGSAPVETKARLANPDDAAVVRWAASY